MGLRELINDRPGFSLLFTLIIVIAAVVLFVKWRQREQAAMEIGALRGLAYYTVDDGATFFADEMHGPSPFKKDGRDAYLVRVFRCGDGEPFVAYLVRYDPEMVAEMEQYRGKRYPGSGAELRDRWSAGTEVRRPGQTVWVKESDRMAAGRITAVNCPDGEPPRPVSPPSPPVVPPVAPAAAAMN